MNLSYWEKKELFEDLDFCITGAGIVGLHTAWFLKQQYPKAKILVLEKSNIGAAASSKNAGFACFGSVSEILDDINTFGADTAFELIKMRWEGLQLLQNINGTNNLGLELHGGYELFRKEDEETFEKCRAFVPELNERLAYIGSGVYEENTPSPYPFRNVSNLIFNQFEGQVETNKMYFNLEIKIQQLGVVVLRGMEVSGFEDIGSKVEIQLAGGLEFQAGKLLITNNGFARRLLPNLEVKPARAQVLVTSPIENFGLKGTFHYDKGYYYFRNIGNRLLIGGGRNANFEAEETYDQVVTEEILSKIKELMYGVILKEEVSIDYTWAGTMGLGPTKYPIIKRLSDNVSCGVRMGGMGVAIGAGVAKKLSEI